MPQNILINTKGYLRILKILIITILRDTEEKNTECYYVPLFSIYMLQNPISIHVAPLISTQEILTKKITVTLLTKKKLRY